MTPTSPAADTTTESVITTSPTRGRRRAVVGASAAAAVVAIGAGGFAVTSAYFTDQETITGNTVGTATLTIGTVTGIPITVADLLPDQTSGPETFTFTNSGSVDFDYSITLDNVVVSPTQTPTDLATITSWLEVTLASGTSTDSGSLASVPELVGAGTVAPGASGTATIEVGLSDTATNLAQGLDITFDVIIDAAQ
ncbi:putative ribosomally synthesized peptide with SipW-like signal peptide [Glaciihabitans tibetensis]|uniref:Putative ribosomally synthesized peptide with SipW-like signal peptide n=1 Tax=Glaciihabitans tibetensis TaxID=1266600 RepID=A0A2T0VCN3_9MICO|nr:SipW-dependent-type signal peptide-containing protein [Glaciihabitans tibetensis]PRY67845.1 putative ribosomally synthesized peptide with SipW-like signal peptide [Glaciihabitans tibetensis]